MSISCINLGVNKEMKKGKQDLKRTQQLESTESLTQYHIRRKDYCIGRSEEERGLLNY